LELRGFIFKKKKTAYEILTCDWSSDVCSSDVMGFLSKIWENWGKGKNSGIEIKSAKKAPAIKKTKKKKNKKKK